MDPLSSVKEFRDQQGSRSRVVKIAPPPPPILPPAVPAATDVVDLDDTGELDLTVLNGADPTTGDPTPSDDHAGRETRAFARGRKVVVQVNLPAPTRALLDAAREVHGTFGKATMAALRGSYQWLVDTYTPEPVEAVGPFPAPRPTRRRLSVEDPRMRQLLVDPAEATGIETLADQLEMSLSELVTLAIDKHYGEGGSLPVDPSPARPSRAKR